jgi:hypothetical protein
VLQGFVPVRLIPFKKIATKGYSAVRGRVCIEASTFLPGYIGPEHHVPVSFPQGDFRVNHFVRVSYDFQETGALCRKELAQGADEIFTFFDLAAEGKSAFRSNAGKIGVIISFRRRIGFCVFYFLDVSHHAVHMVVKK